MQTMLDSPSMDSVLKYTKLAETDVSKLYLSSTDNTLYTDNNITMIATVG